MKIFHKLLSFLFAFAFLFSLTSAALLEEASTTPLNVTPVQYDENDAFGSIKIQNAITSSDASIRIGSKKIIKVDGTVATYGPEAPGNYDVIVRVSYTNKTTSTSHSEEVIVPTTVKERPIPPFKP